MKMIKKIGILFMSLCLCVPCFSLVAHAEDGRISFTDPKTAVGEIVEVTCAVRSTAGNVGDVEIGLTYDSAYLRFDSGDGVTAEGDGALTYSGSGSSAELKFTMKFQALQEGSTKVEISSAAISSDAGASLTMTEGQSTVEIGEGDPSKITEGGGSGSIGEDIQVEVNGTSYMLTDDFADADIPSGYSRTQVELDGQQRQMLTNETETVTLAYLLDGEENGDFFLYNTENATFAPYEELTISDTTSIIILSDTSQVDLPASYQEANLTLNGKDFPVWQDTARDGFYVLYAMNNNGETGYYQYDQAENTYQRFTVTDTPKEEEGQADTSSFLGKLQNLIDRHFTLFAMAGGLIALIVLIILIVQGVKLHNRNAEIDELYDEYGIDLEDKEPIQQTQGKGAGKGRQRPVEDDFDDFDEDDFDDYEEDDFGEDDFDDYEEEDFQEDDFGEDDFEEALSDDDLRDLDFDEPEDDEMGYTGKGLADELPIDDLDALLGETPKKKRGHMEEDDTFKVDFVDLD